MKVKMSGKCALAILTILSINIIGCEPRLSGLSLRPDHVLPAPATQPKGNAMECKDSPLAKGCKSWKQIGYCRKGSRFYDYMQAYCRETCSLCNQEAEVCADDINYAWMCPSWKKSGSCKVTKGVFGQYIKVYCKKTCGFCKKGESSFKNKEVDVLNASECGQGKGGINIQPGGGEAEKNSWPWQMSLLYYTRFICGAVLISKQWALTAAHCVQSKADIPEEIIGVLGEHDRYVDEGKEIKVTADKIVIHPGYSEKPLKDDIALIKFKLPIKFNEYIRPACLPTNGQRPSIGQYCFTTGWGRIRQKRGPSFRFLQEISLPVVSCSRCQKSNGFKIDSKSMCAGFSTYEMVDGCTTDSGGPLSCIDSNFNWQLMGILSWGQSSCPPSGQYKVYTRVDSYVDWIKEVFNKN